ncbi:MAG: dephospho-CoA kinase [Terricaulis sp.]
MKRVGLTGSIGMGKTTVARMFAEEGASVFDSDAAVHALYAVGGEVVEPVGAAFPGVVKDGAIDRQALSARVLDDPDALRRLEAIVHPLVRAAQAHFVASEQKRGAGVVIFDVPLLYETGADSTFDKVVVVTAPPEIQRARVLARPGMSPEKFAAILARQTPDSEKRARAHFVIENGGSLNATRSQVRAVLDALREQD